MMLTKVLNSYKHVLLWNDFFTVYSFQARGKKKPIGWFPANHVKLLQQKKTDSLPRPAARKKAPAPAAPATVSPAVDPVEPAHPKVSTVSEPELAPEDIYSVPTRKKRMSTLPTSFYILFHSQSLRSSER